MKAFSAYITFLIVCGFVIYGLYSVGVIYEKSLFCTECETDINLTEVEKFIGVSKSILLFLPFKIFENINSLTLVNDPYMNTSILLFVSLFITFFMLYLFYFIFKQIYSYIKKEEPIESY